MKSRQELTTEEIGQRTFIIKLEIDGYYLVDQKSITVDTVMETDIINADNVGIVLCKVGKRMSLYFKKEKKGDYINSQFRVKEIWEIESVEEFAEIFK